MGILSLAPSLVGLKFFVIRGNYFNKVIVEVSRELVWLRWFQIGQRNLPSGLSLKNLRVLELYEQEYGEHHLEELWGECDGEVPVQLRELSISRCHKFQGFPNSIPCLSYLKKIVIIDGFNVRSLPQEFCSLQWLEHLVLHGCKMLSSLPSNFGNLRNLRHLDLSSCKNSRSLPVSFKNLMLLEHLNLWMCEKLTFTSEDLDILENVRKLKFLCLSYCRQVEELPRHITKQASLRQLYLNGTRLRHLPVNIGQLSRLQEMRIGSELLTRLPSSLGDLSSLLNLSIKYCPNLESLPTSLGDLISLTRLEIDRCPKLESLPDSVGHLNLLEELVIKHSGMKSQPKSVRQLDNLQRLVISHCPISELDFGALLLPFALSNLKLIFLEGTEVCKISISEDFCPCLEELQLLGNPHLTEVKVLPTTVKSIELANCEMLKTIPSFKQLTSLREFDLINCYQVEKIEGLEYCTRLESLIVDTCWEVPGIESLEQMQKLRTLELRANKGSAIERCIQTIQKWPDEIQICTQTVPDAASLVNSILSSNHLVVVDSFANQKIQSRPTLLQKRPSNGDAIMLCYVINCVSSQITLSLLWGGVGLVMAQMEIDEGKWVWIGVFTQRSTNEWLTVEEISISGYEGECEEEDEVEKGLLLRGEEQRLVEAFHSLLPLLKC